jgi:hypothetical protein
VVGAVVEDRDIEHNDYVVAEDKHVSHPEIRPSPKGDRRGRLGPQERQ